MSPQSDLQKKDELRREKRFLELIFKLLEKDDKETIILILSNRIEDIEKALED